MAKNLTTEQKSILKNLEKEFESINNLNANISGTLINVAEIKQFVSDKDKFNKECEAQNLAYNRKVHQAIVADAERLRPDLNALGLDVDYRNDGYCGSSFSIIKFGDENKRSLLRFDYVNHQYQEVKRFDVINRLYKTYKIRVDLSVTMVSWYSDFHTLEEMTNDEKFKKRIIEIYEKINK
jgi:hypothetical protein